MADVTLRQIRAWAAQKHNCRVAVCAFGGFEVTHADEPLHGKFARTIDDIMPKVLAMSDNPSQHTTVDAEELI